MSTNTKQTLILNSQNKKDFNSFEYVLPSNVQFKKNDKLALESISLYNSFFNIEASRNNNLVTLTWNADSIVEYNYVIPDGNYSVTQLNLWLQSKMAYDNLYMLTVDSEIVYYAEINTEPSLYATSLTLYNLPTSANATILSYTIPAGASWTFPVTNDKTPLLTLNIALGKLLGFTNGIYPTVVQTTTQIFMSDLVPQLSPTNSIILCCNLLNSAYSNPSNVLSSLPLKESFGRLMDFVFSDPTLYNISPSSYRVITVTFYDQLYQKLNILDNDVIIRLTLEISEETK